MIKFSTKGYFTKGSKPVFRSRAWFRINSCHKSAEDSLDPAWTPMRRSSANRLVNVQWDAGTQRRTKSVKRHYTECPERTTIQRVSGNLRLSPYGLTSNFTKEKITGSNITDFRNFLVQPSLSKCWKNWLLKIRPDKLGIPRARLDLTLAPALRKRYFLQGRIWIWA